MDYNDADAKNAVINTVKTAVNQFKDHPALLMWGVGNEGELQISESRRDSYFSFLNDLVDHDLYGVNAYGPAQYFPNIRAHFRDLSSSLNIKLNRVICN